MTPSIDPQVIVETLRRQGISLPPERQDQVTATAARLASTSRALEERLTLAADIYGFQTLLRQKANADDR
jgi:hypothetical protein